MTHESVESEIFCDGSIEMGYFGSTILREKAFALRSKEISIYKDMEQFSCVRKANRCRTLRIIRQFAVRIV